MTPTPRTGPTNGKGWIGVDLDGTLAEDNGYDGPTDIGPPVPGMVERVKEWLAKGREVRVVTARVSPLADFQDWRRAGVGGRSSVG